MANQEFTNDEYYNEITDRHVKGAISLEFGSKAYTQAMEETDLETKITLFRKALHWYTISADFGNGQAACNIGYIYAYGRLGEKNSELAAQWFAKGAGLGNEEACYKLGDCYNYGSGRPKDLSQAYEWYCKAEQLAEQNCSPIFPPDAAIVGSIYLRLATCIEHGCGGYDSDKDRLEHAHVLYGTAEHYLRNAEFGGVTWYHPQRVRAGEGVQRTIDKGVDPKKIDFELWDRYRYEDVCFREDSE